MILRYHLSGSLVFETQATSVPPPGTKVIFRMLQRKKGIEHGALVSAIIQGEPLAPVYDYSEGEQPIVFIDLGEFEELTSYDRS